MIRTDRSFSDTVAGAVREAEKGSTAEIVVVAAARSGSYVDVALGAGGIAALAALLVALFAPVTFHPAAVAVEVPLAFGLVAWLVHRTPALLGVLAPRARMRSQVERAAAAHFLAEAVHGTKGRTGLLVYVSLLEGRVALIPDLGLEAKVPAQVWAALRFSGSDGRTCKSVDDLVAGIRTIGELLRARAPGTDVDGNEIPDAPRIVP